MAVSPRRHTGFGAVTDPTIDSVDDDASPIDLDPVIDLRPLDERTLRDRLDDVRSGFVHHPMRHVIPLTAVLVAVGVGWWLLRPPQAPPIESLIPRADTAAATAQAHADPQPGGSPGSVAEGAGPAAAATDSATSTTGELVVQAAGAVGTPGVYRLPAGSRVDDLVRAAGGMSSDADGDRVNLAAPITDGERIWVPRQGEEGMPEVVAGTGTGRADPAAGSGGTGSQGGGGLVDLNTASATELQVLPGVGPATAAAIVEHRQSAGPYPSVDALLDVRGIGEAKLEQIRPHATV